jgi:hypothetical protein
MNPNFRKAYREVTQNAYDILHFAIRREPFRSVGIYSDYAW